MSVSGVRTVFGLVLTMAPFVLIVVIIHGIGFSLLFSKLLKLFYSDLWFGIKV